MGNVHTGLEHWLYEGVLNQRCKDDWGRTALQWACYKGHRRIECRMSKRCIYHDAQVPNKDLWAIRVLSLLLAPTYRLLPVPRRAPSACACGDPGARSLVGPGIPARARPWAAKVAQSAALPLARGPPAQGC